MKLYKKKIKQENIFKNPIIMDKKKKAQSPRPRWPRALGPPKKALAHDPETTHMSWSYFS
jgi:hypothetical protein